MDICLKPIQANDNPLSPTLADNCVFNQRWRPSWRQLFIMDHIHYALKLGGRRVHQIHVLVHITVFESGFPVWYRW
jgi:hypothetical protein